MADMMYIGITILFFILTGGLLKLCDLLSDNSTGEKS